jgi:hypothetical protein
LENLPLKGVEIVKGEVCAFVLAADQLRPFRSVEKSKISSSSED